MHSVADRYVGKGLIALLPRFYRVHARYSRCSSPYTCYFYFQFPRKLRGVGQSIDSPSTFSDRRREGSVREFSPFRPKGRQRIFLFLFSHSAPGYSLYLTRGAKFWSINWRGIWPWRGRLSALIPGIEASL